MSLSQLELDWVLEEVAPAIQGGAIREVHDSDGGTVFVTVRVPGSNLVFALSTRRSEQRLHVVSQRPRSHAPPSAFTQLLRKHLVGGRVVCLERYPDERIVSLTVSTPQDAALGARIVLLVELFGHGGFALLDGGGVVRGTPRPSPRAQVGAVYARPQPSRQERSAALRFAADREVPFPRSAAIATFYDQLSQERACGARFTELRARLARALRKVERRIAALSTDMERAQEAQTLRVYGDVLAANFQRIPKGASSVVLENFYANMEPITIPLDPSVGVSANIERTYKRYKRYHAALPAMRQRLDEAESAALLLYELADESATGGPWTPASLDALELRLSQAGARRKAPQAPGARAPDALPFRTFRSHTGKDIWVGRSARKNDEMTFRFARGNDLWLHARDVPGSHVVVRLVRGEPIDQETLLDAATLAAHHSRARGERVVEILYTMRKHVRRAPGSAAGRVLTADAKHMTVRVDQERLARLYADPDQA